MAIVEDHQYMVVVMATPRHLMTHSYSIDACNYGHFGLLELKQPHSIHILANFECRTIARLNPMRYFIMFYYMPPEMDLRLIRKMEISYSVP